MCRNVNKQPQSAKPNLKRCFSLTNINKFNSLLEDVAISAVLRETCPNPAFAFLMKFCNQSKLFIKGGGGGYAV